MILKKVYDLKNINHNNFSKLLEKSAFTVTPLEKQIIEGIVIAIKDDVLIINLGLKKNIRFPIKELVLSNDTKIKPGDSILFYIEQLKTRDGEIILNYDKAQKELKSRNVWKMIQKNEKFINGIILNYVNGGFSVGIAGMVAFLPKNQILPTKGKKPLVGSLKTFSLS